MYYFERTYLFNKHDVFDRFDTKRCKQEGRLVVDGKISYDNEYGPYKDDEVSQM